MHTHLDTRDDVAIVTLSGRLTFAENAAFRRVVEAVAQQTCRDVVLDLSGLDFLDSAGMGMLLVVRDLVAGRGGRATLRGADGQVARMLLLAKFGDFFALDFAVGGASFAAGQSAQV